MVRDRDQDIYIAGHRGMVGSALVRRLTALGYTNLLTATHAELDLLEQAAVNGFFARASSPASPSTRSSRTSRCLLDLGDAGCGGLPAGSRERQGQSHRGAGAGAAAAG